MTALLMINIMSCIVYFTLTVIMLRMCIQADSDIEAVLLLVVVYGASYWAARSLDQVVQLLTLQT